MTLTLLQRETLKEVAVRYARALDRCDLTGVLDCFADDCVFNYDGGRIRVDGKAQAAEFFAHALESPSTHLLGNFLIDETASGATLQCSAIACLTRKPGEIMLRGLLYAFHCRETGDGWIIAEVDHRATWQGAAPGGPLPG